MVNQNLHGPLLSLEIVCEITKKGNVMTGWKEMTDSL